MKEKELQEILINKEKLNKKIEFYSKRKIIQKTESKFEIKGHLKKAHHNLNFIYDTKSKYNDWILVACYYAIYHAVLAALIKKGVTSKNHDATLCLLIKEFYEENLSKEEIELINKFQIEDILFYTYARKKREEANYSTQILFEENKVKTIIKKTITIINKIENIIEQD